MNKISNPLETLIDFAWASGADIFWVNNAKDELKRLVAKAEKDSDFFGPIAWTTINSSVDFHNFSIVYNEYIKYSVPVYVKTKDVEQALSSISADQQS